MKSIITIIASISFLAIHHTMKAQSENMDTFSVEVQGMGCPFCAYGLEKKFKELKGIENIEIKIETGIMHFQYPSNTLQIEDVEKQVEKAGYTPVKTHILEPKTISKKYDKETLEASIKNIV